MEVYSISFSKDDLVQLKEHKLILQLGHMCNEIAFLHKLLIAVSDTERPGIERTGATAQAMIVSRIFIGKVFEAWLMLGKEYFGTDLPKEFGDEISGDAKEALDRLRKSFGSTNLLSIIRNKFAFHYLSEHIDEIMGLIPDEMQMRLITGGRNDNTLYSFAEDVITYAMLNRTGESTPQQAMDKLIGTLVSVSGDLLNFSTELLAVILHRRLKVPLEQCEWLHHSLESVADLNTFRIPFFFERS